MRSRSAARPKCSSSATATKPFNWNSENMFSFVVRRGATAGPTRPHPWCSTRYGAWSGRWARFPEPARRGPDSRANGTNTEPVDYWLGGLHHTPMDAHTEVPIELVLRAIAEYVRTGERPTCVEWIPAR
ncbi:Imm1 family immunity protein [Saccharopolyspora hattusasensis]|uniref:Imm1 family immunity protein n=1 Tax=Saccharopolyspora hattusasensis TaxID=1128679 RepID=UPI003D9662E9